LLDDSSERAVAIDVSTPLSAERLTRALVRAWPRLEARLERIEGRIEDVEIEPSDLVVSVHACGVLTDRVLDRAIAGSARVAVLPCCHALDTGDGGGLSGWMDGTLAMDATRAARLRSAGYVVHTQTIPGAITPKNRLLLGEPPKAGAG
jgi:hypothetical protein